MSPVSTHHGDQCLPKQSNLVHGIRATSSLMENHVLWNCETVTKAGVDMVESTVPVVFDWSANLRRTMEIYRAKLEEANRMREAMSCPSSPAKRTSSLSSSDTDEDQPPPIRWSASAMLFFLGSPEIWVVPKSINGMR